jgi:hypothetical protein
MAKFEVRWEVSDGYVGGGRPQTFTIDAEDFDGMTEQQIEDAIYGQANDAMLEIVSPSIRNLEEAVEWVKANTPPSGASLRA